MNNFRIYFKQTTTLEIGGEKITFLGGKTAAFRNVSDKETKAIRKACIKENNMLFAMTDDARGAYKVVYGNKARPVVEESVKAYKGSKKDKFKNYVPKTKQEKNVEEEKVEDEKCVKITQNSLTEEKEDEIINTEKEGTDEQV